MPVKDRDFIQALAAFITEYKSTVGVTNPDAIEAMNALSRLLRLSREFDAAPGTMFVVGDAVEKYSGDYVWEGVITAVFNTPGGALRYVVAHPVETGWVLHIYSEQNLRMRSYNKNSADRKEADNTHDRTNQTISANANGNAGAVVDRQA